jgi:hypothetical protein
MERPLIHIGYHKAGSTWLQLFLFNNKDIGFVSPFLREDDIGENIIYPNSLKFSIKDCTDHYYNTISQAKDGNLVPVLSYERLAGNPHSGGYDGKEIANRLGSVFPRARILIIIREQRSMILSTYKQYIIEGGPCKVNRYLTPTDQGKGRIPFFLFEYFEYNNLIEYYMNLFNKSNVLVLPYEEFKLNPQSFIHQILIFSGINANHSLISKLPYHMHVNVALSGIAIDVKRRLNFVFADDRLNPGALFPSSRYEQTSTWLLRKIDNLLPLSVKKIYDNHLRKKIYHCVGNRYKKSNEMTSKLINKELSGFGYDS